MTETLFDSNIPFAFDLSLEKNLIQRHQDDYWPFFRTQVGYYLAESHGRVCTTPYYHDIRQDELGRHRIGHWINGFWTDAEQSYQKAANDDSKQRWLQERLLKDINWAKSINTYLSGENIDDLLIDLSPAPFATSLKERRLYQFSNHSFARLHRVEQTKGGLRLVSRALRNYLPEKEQETLFYQLTSKRVGQEGLLGRVEKASPGISEATIWQMIRQLYESVPQKRKIPIPDEELNSNKIEEVEKALTEFEPQLREIFNLMKNNGLEKKIEKRFHSLEVEVKRILSKYIDKLPALKVNQSEGAESREYQPGKSDCGSGAGFRKLKAWKTEGKQASGETCEEICCKRCGWKPDARHLELIEKGYLHSCPICGWRPK